MQIGGEQTPRFGKPVSALPWNEPTDWEKGGQFGSMPAFQQPIDFRGENPRSTGRRPRRLDSNPPAVTRDPEQLSGRCHGVVGYLSPSQAGQAGIRRSSRTIGCSGTGSTFRYVRRSRRRSGADWKASIWQSVYCPIQRGRSRKIWLGAECKG